MWDTVQHIGRGHGLSHDLPCIACGHAAHTFLACSDSCACEPPPMPGMPDRRAGRRAAEPSALTA